MYVLFQYPSGKIADSLSIDSAAQPLVHFGVGVDGVVPQLVVAAEVALVPSLDLRQ